MDELPQVGSGNGGGADWENFIQLIPGAVGTPENQNGVAPGQGGTHGIDRLAVGCPGGGEVAGSEGDVVLEGQVDDTIGVGRGLGQAGRVVQVALEHGDPGCFELLGRRIGPGQPDHLMASFLEFGDDG